MKDKIFFKTARFWYIVNILYSCNAALTWYLAAFSTAHNSGKQHAWQNTPPPHIRPLHWQKGFEEKNQISKFLARQVCTCTLKSKKIRVMYEEQPIRFPYTWIFCKAVHPIGWRQRTALIRGGKNPHENEQKYPSG